MPVGTDGLITAPRDYLTILVVRHPRDALMTKRLFRASDGTVGKTNYDKASLFDVRQQRVESFTGTRRRCAICPTGRTASSYAASRVIVVTKSAAVSTALRQRSVPIPRATIGCFSILMRSSCRCFWNRTTTRNCSLAIWCDCCHDRSGAPAISDNGHAGKAGMAARHCAATSGSGRVKSAPTARWRIGR